MKKEIKEIIRNTEKAVKPKMKDYQRVSVIVKDDGHVIVLHTHPFTERMAWVEYDTDKHNLTLISRNGNLYDTGLTVQEHLRPLVMQSKQASLVWMEDDKISDIYSLPLTSRDINTLAAPN